jgi:hypothetical protein
MVSFASSRVAGSSAAFFFGADLLGQQLVEVDLHDRENRALDVGAAGFHDRTVHLTASRNLRPASAPSRLPRKLGGAVVRFGRLEAGVTVSC